MALAEDGRQAAGRPLVERSMARNPKNANGAHALAHVCYEDGETNAARAFLAGGSRSYPRNGFFHGHLSWHLALGRTGCRTTRPKRSDCSGRRSGLTGTAARRNKRYDGRHAFLWRAGTRRASARRLRQARRCMSSPNGALPRPSNGLADLHVDPGAGRHTAITAGLQQRVRQIEDLAREGRYPSGPYLPALSRAFAAFEVTTSPPRSRRCGRSRPRANALAEAGRNSTSSSSPC